MSGDKIDRAIEAATVPVEKPIPTMKYTLTLSSGKPAKVEIANDADDRDWLDLLAIIVSQVRPAHMQFQEANKSPLEKIAKPGLELIRGRLPRQ